MRRRRAKASPRRGQGIASCESFPTAWARNRTVRKLPHGVGKELQACESFPTAWARNRTVRKLPHGVGTESQVAKASPRRGEEIASLRAIKIALFHAAQRIKGWNHVLKKLKKHVSTLFFFISSMF